MIAIIDYDVGNLHSVKSALNHIGQDCAITRGKEDIACADGIILPGVGAFPDAMKSLRQKGLDEVIKSAAKAGKPILGICLGMQLLFDGSDEGEEVRGLSLIPGRITRIKTSLKIPHMGWNSLVTDKSIKLLDGISNGKYVYFVHSFHACPEDINDRAAHCLYDGEVTACVSRGNIYGCQFHPEKSSEVGLRILSNFALIVESNRKGL